MRKVHRQSNSLGMQADFNSLVGSQNMGNVLQNKQIDVNMKGKLMPTINECENNYESVQQINNQKCKIPGAKHKIFNNDNNLNNKTNQILNINNKDLNKRHSLILVNQQDKENEQINGNQQNQQQFQVQQQLQQQKQQQQQYQKQQEEKIQKEKIQQISSSVSIQKSRLQRQRELEDDKLRINYGKDIYKNLSLRVEKMDNYLEKHEITSRLRGKMIDWMVEVLSSYKCSEQTFFCAVHILDSYFRKSERRLKVSELHLSGVVAMWMASKYEEIYPLRLKTLETKIAHNKLSANEIRAKETEIISVINFQFEEGSIYEQALLISSLINIDAVFNSQKTKDYFSKVIIYLTKMVMHDYSILTSISKSYLTTATLFVAFKIIEQIQTSFSTQKISHELLKFTQQNEEKLYDAAQKVLNLAKNFETIFPGLENLKKFNGFQLDEQK